MLRCLPRRALFPLLLCLWASIAQAVTYQVGPTRALKTPCAAAPLVADNDIVEIDAGPYVKDACAWTKNGLTLRGVGGVATLDSQGAHALGKGIWVLQGRDTTVEFVEFVGATVPDGNGAGIRQEGVGLAVRNSIFRDGQNSILTNNQGANRTSDVLIEYCEFARNGTGDGYTHNLYIGEIRQLTYRYNWSHDSKGGQLLKSRAAVNIVVHNRLVDSPGGGSNYEVDIGNGGNLTFVGNVVRQDAQTANSTILAYMPEGPATLTDHRAVIASNTFINERFAATFLNIRGAPMLTILDNVFVGPGIVHFQNNATQPVSAQNIVLPTLGAAQFLDVTSQQYRPTLTSPVVDMGGHLTGEIMPFLSMQYAHPARSAPRTQHGATWDAGAYEADDTPSPGPLYAPRLTSRQVDAGHIALTWSAVLVEGATPQYQVVRNTMPLPMQSAVSLTETLTPGLATTYQVAAVVDEVVGPPSLPLTVAVPRTGTSIPPDLGWTELLGTALAGHCPANVPGNIGCRGVVDAWNSAAVDTKRNRLILFGGGHTDYYGNEFYAITLSPLGIARLTEPGKPFAANVPCPESLAGGAQPNSRHTYDGLAYLPNKDQLFVFGGSLACTDPSTMVSRGTWTYDFTSGAWTQHAMTGTRPLAVESPLSAYDPVSDAVYVHDRQCLYRFDATAGTYAQLACLARPMVDAMKTAIVDPARRRLYVFGGYGAYQISLETPYAALTLPVDQFPARGYYPGLAYDPLGKRVVAYAGGNTLYALDAGSYRWTPETFVAGPSLATPAQGTFKRFAFSEASGVFVFLRDGGSNLFSLRTVAPMPPATVQSVTVVIE